MRLRCTRSWAAERQRAVNPHAKPSVGGTQPPQQLLSVRLGCPGRDCSHEVCSSDRIQAQAGTNRHACACAGSLGYRCDGSSGSACVGQRGICVGTRTKTSRLDENAEGRRDVGRHGRAELSRAGSKCGLPQNGGAPGRVCDVGLCEIPRHVICKPKGWQVGAGRSGRAQP
jgi:hypothetical protein